MKGIPYITTFLNKLDWKIYIKQRNWPPVVKITNFEPENEARTKKIKPKKQIFKKFLFLLFDLLLDKKRKDKGCKIPINVTYNDQIDPNPVL